MPGFGAMPGDMPGFGAMPSDMPGFGVMPGDMPGDDSFTPESPKYDPRRPPIEPESPSYAPWSYDDMKKHIIIVPKIILTPENKVTEDMMGGGEEEFNEY